MRGKQHVVRMLHAGCKMLWGFPPNMIPLVVESKGSWGALRWFLANMPRFLDTMRVLGPVRVHLACVVISLRNGCLYCAYGHVYALELLHLRDRGRLFPLDARHMESWMGLDDHTLQQGFRRVLAEAGLHVEALWVDRVLALAAGTLPMDAAEARLAHVVRMVTEMNAVAVAGGAELDEAHDPVNKNALVKAEHAALRAASARA